MKSLSDIIRRPVLTEKATALQEESNTYVFEVSPSSNKIEVAKAVSALYGVQVESVRTQVRRGSLKRFGRHFGRQRLTKRAFVRLAEGSEINIFEAIDGGS
jgi:large subunit ribosomal protein L23